MIEKKDWIVIQKAFLSSVKATHNWLTYLQSSGNLDKTLTKSLIVFFADNLARLGQPLSSDELGEIYTQLEENCQPD